MFITGLSAGGAMANAMLTAYPEVFAGGAIIAGLPYGVASTVPEAFDRMRGHGLPSRERLQERHRSASTYSGPWPTISVWHGTADKTVDELNARAIVDQWKAVYDVGDRPTRSDVVYGHEHHVWTNEADVDAIELHRIVGISSTEFIARNWGLKPSFERRAEPHAGSHTLHKSKDDRKNPSSIQDVIESALRSTSNRKPIRWV